MKSATHGGRTSAVEVVNVSMHGFWLLIGATERFVPFEQFPWFRKASIGHLLNVELPSPHHLHWPDLDIDLALDSLDHPTRFPLISKARPNTPAGSRASARGKCP
ncbi:MAG: DUF2442 domain-containing protein [Planctomycetes bacterium]|nr:DUF2442 domain-containing protein [Planctomycetota bacterium]